MNTEDELFHPQTTVAIFLEINATTTKMRMPKIEELLCIEEEKILDLAYKLTIKYILSKSMTYSTQKFFYGVDSLRKTL